jgi:flagellin-like protein
MNKKALSDIVSTLLLILIVLLAIGLIWFFIRPLIFKTETVQEGGSCITVRFSPVECSYTRSDVGNATGGGRHSLVLIRRDGDESAPAGFELVFTDKSGATKIVKDTQTVFSTNKSLNSGEAKTYIADIDKFVPTSFTIAALVGKSVCAPLSTPIECKPYTGPTPCADVINGTSKDWGNDYFLNGDDFDTFALFYYQYKLGIYNDPHLDFNGDSVINDQDYEVFVDAFNQGTGNPNC